MMVENKYPILEFDYARTAKLEPSLATDETFTTVFLMRMF